MPGKAGEATAIETNNGRPFPQVNPAVVGLAGLEPAAIILIGDGRLSAVLSSLSAGRATP
jgi:hypothetical protein